MTALTIDLPPEIYARLHAEAERTGKSVTLVVQEWLGARFQAQEPHSDRERAHAVLRAAGLVVEDPLGPELRQRAEGIQVTLEEVSADLARAGGRPLSEIILEQRGPKG